MDQIVAFFQNIGDDFFQAVIAKNRWLMYLEGLGVTVIISIGAILLGVLLGTLVAIVKVNCKDKRKASRPMRFFNALCTGYLAIIRGTPSVVQLLIWCFVIFAAWPMNMGIVVAIIAFGCNSGAYVAEIIRSGIQAVDRGQEEAGRSLGLSKGKTMQLIILPQAVKNILPALGNELIVLVKETAIVGYIAIGDLTHNAMLIKGATYQAWIPLIMAAIIYFIVVYFMAKGIRALERRLARSDYR